MGITQIYAQCYQCTGTNNTGFSIGTGVATGNNSFAGGNLSGASGNNSFAFGTNAYATHVDGIAIGNYVNSAAANAYLFGQNLSSGVANSITIGLGTSSSSLLSNSKAGSIMFGVTHKPSLTIAKPENGDVGYLGIGTTDPQQKVHLDEGNLLISSVNSGTSNTPAGALLFGDVIDFNYPNGKWGIEYLNSSNPTFGGQGLNFRRYNLKSMGMPQLYSVLFLADNGRVGIRTKEPQAELDVAGSFRTQSAAINGNISIPNFTNATAGLQQNALVFGVTEGLQMAPAPSKWGIERVYSNTEGACLNFWKYDFGSVHGGNGGLRSVMYFSDSENVGIGTENPQAKLDISGNIKATDATIAGKLGISTPYTPLTNLQIGDEWTFQNAPAGKNIGRNTYFNGTEDVRIKTGVASRIAFNKTGDILLQTARTGSAGSTFSWSTVTFANNGDVTIGATNQPAKLVVNGTFKAQDTHIAGLLCAKQVRVMLSGSPCWPDYVFSKEYNLMPLKELEQFVNKNQHLPNVPSASEVETNGIDLGEMNAILLKKMEEMTLYILDLQKQINELKK